MIPPNPAPQPLGDGLAALLEAVENESLRFGTRSNEEHWAKTAAARRSVIDLVERLRAERDRYRVALEQIHWRADAADAGSVVAGQIAATALAGRETEAT